MSFQSKRELLAQTAPRYREASHAQKSIILDEFSAATGYARKYAIRLLHRPVAPPFPIKRPRPPHYGKAVQEALTTAWAAANYICAKRLIPFLPTLIPQLSRHGHLQLSDQVRAQLLAISPATADRLLRAARQADRPAGVLPLFVVDNSGILRSTSDDGHMQVLVTGSIDRERVCVSYSP